jgi:hypothetical protein
MTLLIVAAMGMIALGAASWGLYSANRFRIPTLCRVLNGSVLREPP